MKKGEKKAASLTLKKKWEPPQPYILDTAVESGADPIRREATLRGFGVTPVGTANYIS